MEGEGTLRVSARTDGGHVVVAPVYLAQQVHQQSMALAGSSHAPDDQAFLDVAGPGGQWHFDGGAPDVTPDGKNVVFTAASPTDICGVGITDLSGVGFRQIAQSGDCGVFLADEPAVSPNGRKLAYTAGNENPQLDVVLVNKNDQCCAAIFTGSDVPLNADWQPKP